ncbi:MAG: C4-type zinc ribbon domain-containing protein [Verrucomicrobiales bacterium]|nr:C4-type zinc ribbon domain-containing protein [Verrucomicrobiales bacterium]
MLEQLENLLVIQDRDQKAKDLSSELERMPIEKEQACLRLTNSNEAVSNAEEIIMVNEVAMKNIELDVNTRKDSITKLKIQQYETRKNEEFKAMEHEIDRYSDEITELEDSQLELMEKGETLSAQLSEAKADLDKNQQTVDAEISIISERSNQCTKQLEEIKEKRATISSKIEDDLLDKYNRIFKSKKGIAVCELDLDICTGCHMKVIPATVAAVRGEKTITICDQCGRILYQSY